jgi:hypothetical protein
MDSLPSPLFQTRCLSFLDVCVCIVFEIHAVRGKIVL